MTARLLSRLAGAACTILLLAGAVRTAEAQGAYRLTLARDAQVRITTTAAPRTRVTGLARELRGDTLLLAQPGSGRTLAYPLADLHSLELRGGLDRRRGMLFGALGGAAFGAMLGSEERGSVTAGMAMIGTAVGFAFAPRGWDRLPLPRP